MLKSFSQLKKDLKVGVTVRTIRNNCKPEMTGEIRTISKVQTNAIAFKRSDGKDSWLWWGKANNYEYENNNIKVYDEPSKYNDFKRTLVFEYEIL